MTLTLLHKVVGVNPHLTQIFLNLQSLLLVSIVDQHHECGLDYYRVLHFRLSYLGKYNRESLLTFNEW